MSHEARCRFVRLIEFASYEPRNTVTNHQAVTCPVRITSLLTHNCFIFAHSGPPSLGPDSGPRYSPGRANPEARECRSRGSGCLFLPRASGPGHTSARARVGPEARGSAVQCRVSVFTVSYRLYSSIFRNPTLESARGYEARILSKWRYEPRLRAVPAS